MMLDIGDHKEHAIFTNDIATAGTYPYAGVRYLPLLLLVKYLGAGGDGPIEHDLSHTV